MVSSLVTAISILTQKMLRILQRKLRDWTQAIRVEEVEMGNRGHED